MSSAWECLVYFMVPHVMKMLGLMRVSYVTWISWEKYFHIKLWGKPSNLYNIDLFSIENQYKPI